MNGFLDSLLGSGLPHGYCLAWKPGLLWTFVISDMTIGLAYLSISSALMVFIRSQKDLQFSWMFVLFGIFIFACGLTHFVGVVGIWKPVYHLEAAVKVVTAIASIGTAVVLWPLIGKASQFLSEREALEKSNEALRLELLENSLRDPLTSLYNRRFLSETLSLEDRRGYAIIMLDIDHFKILNDEHGHATGDGVIQAVAGLLQSNTRKGDVICRYGGEEFTIIMRNATLRDGYEQAEKIRRACTELKLITRNGHALGAITLSAGIAAYPTNGDVGRTVLDEADRALYRAKQQGRNRSETASDST
ncbi:MAG: GGDEF domain-containing protein [Pseudomonadota bacterium]|nr:GGDEF domain-containing protein [Pseudomonadota bacterium]